MLRRQGTALLIEPVNGKHVVTLEQGVTAQAIATLPSRLGDALVARLAILAALDVGRAEQQLGRLRLRRRSAGHQGASVDHDVLVVTRASGDGLEAEVRRIVGLDAGIVESGAADVPMEVGQRIGVYRIFAEVGRGGMGVVYRAEHILLGKPVAIKILRAKLTQNVEVCARFLREARAAGRIRHPGIVSTTDFGTLPDGRSFLVMELVEGTTLEALLWKGPLNPSRAVEFARQMADALDAVHGQGVLHRDLKPGNVFIAMGDLVKIGDFGAAKIPDATPEPGRDTRKGMFVGTPEYMSPEHGRGLVTDRRTDLYALGCVFFHMLSGALPYRGSNAMAVLEQHFTAPIPMVVSPHGELPEIFQEIMRRALAKRVEDRYQTAREFCDDLNRAAAALERTGWRRWLPV